jgi:NAD(P)-dependent dehydrogenase (short-subunit alcohol dehydrogenase family)
LINNLGIFEPKPFVEITDQEWMHFFEVNVLSGIRLARFYLPRMLKKDWGRIIFISSESPNSPLGRALLSMQSYLDRLRRKV